MYPAAHAASCKEKPRPSLHLLGLAARAVVAGSPIARFRSEVAVTGSTRAEFEARRLRKFRALVRYANAHSPYYAGIIRERGLDLQSCVPADFPVLTKTLLMANFDAILTDRRITRQVVADFLTRSSDPRELLLDAVTVMHTSGTSGEVGYFLSTPEDRARRTWPRLPMNHGLSRALLRRRKQLRRLAVGFYGATGGHYAGVTSIAQVTRGWRRLLFTARAFEVNAPLPEVLAGLNEYQPDFLLGYTTALRLLADEQRAERLRIAPVVVCATGETATKADLEYLATTFAGAVAFSAYGSTEHMIMGVSSPDGETMTLVEDDLIFECYEDHSLITNLYNFTLPLIRYRMSDILRPIGTLHGPYQVIENLVGRSERMPAFTSANGATDYISPHTINEIFVKGVARFQMQLTGPSTFRFPICLQPGLDAQARAAAIAGVNTRLRQILEQKGLGNVRFDTPVLTDMPLDERTRKFKLIVDLRENS
jgi:phenylacetate-coenzyme A ligase PaaK-like adenylate-forming protein